MTVRIQTDDFDIGVETDLLRSNNAGAVVSFTGLVRDLHGDTTITAMTLEHYPGMTEKELHRIRDEAIARWPISNATIIHRVGRLLPADKIVFVGCTAPHREAAFDATRYIMDFLKTDAPFWKAEESENGVTWLDARDSDRSAAARWKK
ncbi:MAG: molybdopterin synthase catalytic subunit MoaE [Candidatus Puniceispirillales bacterium WSBS_2018_MAG_OTU23]